MKEELKAFKDAAADLVAAWDEDRVAKYPAELGSFDEVMAMLGLIEVDEREDALRRIITRAGLWDDSMDFADMHTGCLFIGGKTLRMGIDYGINDEWQIVLYWNVEDAEDEAYATLDILGEIGLSKKLATPHEVFHVVEPLLAAIRRLTVADKVTTMTGGNADPLGRSWSAEFGVES